MDSYQVLPDTISLTSSGAGAEDISNISVEDVTSSAVLERPTTLPELNSRPASRVMKSFSFDEVTAEYLINTVLTRLQRL